MKYRFRGGKNRKGQEHGLGEMGVDFDDGDRGGYLGMYENGRYEGLGEFRYPDGSVYRGEWSGGSDRHGWGEYITPTGVSFKGRWDHDKLNGKYRGALDKEATARYAYDSISISFLYFYFLSLFLSLISVSVSICVSTIRINLSIIPQSFPLSSHLYLSIYILSLIHI